MVAEITGIALGQPAGDVTCTDDMASRVASIDAERAMQQVAPKMLQGANVADQMQALVDAPAVR